MADKMHIDGHKHIGLDHFPGFVEWSEVTILLSSAMLEVAYVIPRDYLVTIIMAICTVKAYAMANNFDCKRLHCQTFTPDFHTNDICYPDVLSTDSYP